MAHISFDKSGAASSPLEQAAPAPGTQTTQTAPPRRAAVAPTAAPAAAVAPPATQVAPRRAAATPAATAAAPAAAAAPAPRRRAAAKATAPADPQPAPAAAPTVAPTDPYEAAPALDVEAPATPLPSEPQVFSKDAVEAMIKAAVAQAVAQSAPPAPVAVTAPAPVIETTQVQALPPHLRPPAASAYTPAVTTRPALPSAQANRGSFFDDQNIEFSDIQVPSLNLVQKVGELSEIFDPGEVVLDRQLPLPRPVRLMVCGLSAKRYVERVEGEDGQGGNICYSIEEVEQSGGTTLYSEHEQKKIPWYQTLVTALLLVEKHELIEEGDSGLFSFQDPTTGLWYAMARFNMKGTLYNQGAKVFMTARAIGQCTKGYPQAMWTLDTVSFRTRNNRTVIAPKIRFAGATTPEFRNFAQQCFGAAAQ